MTAISRSENLSVREMHLDDVQLKINYFHNGSDELLNLMGVDRDRLPSREAWLQFFKDDDLRPIDERINYSLVWEIDGSPVGFSSTDRIVLGETAFMHLHIIDPTIRGSGFGVQFVRLSTDAYVETLGLTTIYSEPNAFNRAPNRTLQKAGFKYVSTQENTPGPLNYRQITNLWLREFGT